jgi:hypothetical protein
VIVIILIFIINMVCVTVIPMILPIYRLISMYMEHGCGVCGKFQPLVYLWQTLISGKDSEGQLPAILKTVKTTVTQCG